MLLIHVIIAYPFLFSHPRSYLAGAFNLSRQFLYKWTVNWRFLPQYIFLSKEFAYGLLLCHLALLAAFALRKWTTSDGGPVKVLLRAIFRPFIPAAFVLPSGDGMAYPWVVFSRLTKIKFSRNHHHPFHLQPDRHPLCTFTALPVLFVVCAASTFPCLAHTIPLPNKVSVHLTFPNSCAHTQVTAGLRS